MIRAFLRTRTTFLTGSALAFVLTLSAHAQNDQHWRKYKTLPPAGHITVTVEKAVNGKPLSNAAVIFRASRDGKAQGSMEVKTNPDGQAKVDIIEIGSHVTVQVIANGYATGATEFDLQGDDHAIVVKMERPRAQVSAYQDNDGKVSQRPAGVQEPPPIAPKKPVAPPPVAPAPAPSSPQ
jgi:hypothetical protein